MAGVEYQVTKVDPTNPETKGMVYQVNSVTEEVAATMGGKIYRARIIKDPTDPTVAGKVYQIVLIGDPDDPSVKGKVYNAILTGDSEVVVVGPAVSPLSLPDAIANPLSYVKAFGGTEQRNLPDDYIQRQFIYMMDGSYLLTDIVPTFAGHYELEMQTTSVTTNATTYLGSRDESSGNGGLRFAHISDKTFRIAGFGALSTSSGTAANNTKYKFIWDNGSFWVYSGTTLIHSGTFAEETMPTTTPLAINGWNSGGTIGGNVEGIYLYSFKAWNAQGELVADYVPAVQKGTVPVVGFYDTVSKTFKTATAGTFAAGGEAVPTPDTPMDVVSNNGVLKARHQSGLPLGYTLLEYLQSDKNQYIDTGVKTGSATSYGYDLTYQYTELLPGIGNGVTIVGIRQTNSEGGWGNLYWANYTGFTSGRSIYGGLPNSAIQYFEDATNTTTVYTTSFDANKTTRAWSVTDNVSGSFSGTLDRPFDCSDLNVYLFRFNSGTQTLNQLPKVRVYSFIMRVDGNVVRNFIPAKRNSDNEIGMYDLVSGQFFTNQGTGDFVAGNTVSDPVEIYTDGTVETIAIVGRNLYNESTRNDGYYIASDGTITYNAESCYSALIPVLPNTNYTLSADKVATGTAGKRIHAYDTGGNWISLIVGQSIVDTGRFSISGITPANCAYIRISVAKSDECVQVEKGSPATDYVPYFNGGTATAEMLLKVGDYQDEQEIISGVVTRKVGVKVLDGTENWQYSTSLLSNMYSLQMSDLYAEASNVGSNRKSPYCTHFNRSSSWLSSGAARANMVQAFQPSISDATVGLGYGSPSAANLATFKAWLATQYANGTPVIIIYPLKDSTTETVTGQPMATTTGDNTVEITQASLNGLELEAKYMKEGA